MRLEGNIPTKAKTPMKKIYEQQEPRPFLVAGLLLFCYAFYHGYVAPVNHAQNGAKIADNVL